jgi:hypothetical protein
LLGGNDELQTRGLQDFIINQEIAIVVITVEITRQITQIIRQNKRVGFRDATD